MLISHTDYALHYWLYYAFKMFRPDVGLLLFFAVLPYLLGTEHIFPILGQAITLLGLIGLACIVIYSVALCIDSTRENKSLKIGLLSIRAAFTQLLGYGCGFLSAWWKRCVLGKSEFSAYNKTFYK